MFTSSSKVSNAAQSVTASSNIKSYSSQFRNTKLKPLSLSSKVNATVPSSNESNASMSKISTNKPDQSQNQPKQAKNSPPPKMDSKVVEKLSPSTTKSPTTNNVSIDICNVKVSKENEDEIVASLASNIDTSLTLNSSNTSTISLDSSNSSNNATFNSNNVDTNNVSNDENANTSSFVNSEPPKSSSIVKFGTPVPNRVFVGGIPLDATETDVRQLFAQYGTIHSVKIIMDRAGVSRGYGFVTYETESDAQKVIKEAENLIIKNRKLNVSTAVMKHQQSSFDLRNNGPLLYQQLPFANAANYNQFYENYHSLCPAEGMPIYQIAGLNGHFVSNCPPILASQAAQYMTQSAANAFPTPYPNTAGYIYPGVPNGAATSIQLPSQHSQFHPPSQHTNLHLFSNTSIQTPHAFPYSNAACAQSGVSSSNAGLHNLRYSLPSSHHSSNQSSQVNMNSLNSQQQYIQTFSNNASPGINHSLHLATLPIHPQSHWSSLQINPGSEISNQTATTTPTTNLPSTQINPAILHTPSHPPHQSSIYSTYPSNMGNSHSLTANSTQLHCVPNMHMKSDNSGIDVYENNAPAILSTPNINSNGSNSSGTAMTQLPTVHMTNNGYMPQMMEVIWPSATNYCANSNVTLNNAINSSNTINNYGSVNNSKSHQTTSSNRSASSAPLSNSNNHNSYSKSTYSSSQSNNHLSNSILSTTTSSAVNANNSIYVSSKDKFANSRYNNSSYCPSHKKMYNGNSSHFGYGNAPKSKIVNGNVINNGGNTPRYSNSTDTSSDQPMSDYSSSSQVSKQQYYSKLSANSSNVSCSIGRSVTSITTTNVAQNFVTKTVNGVQIYALANNSESSPNSLLVTESSSNNTPPNTPGVLSNNASVISFKT